MVMQCHDRGFMPSMLYDDVSYHIVYSFLLVQETINDVVIYWIALVSRVCHCSIYSLHPSQCVVTNESNSLDRMILSQWYTYDPVFLVTL
jgi:hypothetical protein